MTQTGELKEKFGIETEFNLRQLQRLAKTPYEIKGKLDYIIPTIRKKLQQYLDSEDISSALMDADHHIWQEISDHENVQLNTALLSQALKYFLLQS